MNKTTIAIMANLLKYGRCTILHTAKRDNVAAQELIDLGFAVATQNQTNSKDYYILRLRVTQEAKDNSVRHNYV